MLTQADRTVEDCLDVFELIKPLNIKHIGFKDVGVGRSKLQELHRRIKGQGATSYMEVVSTTFEDCMASARAARELGVDRLLGGTEVEQTLEMLSGTAIAYFPFPGRPEGHPTTLAGSPDNVTADCRRFAALGCAGADLLAFRATEAEPLDLIRAARRATPGELIVAGSIGSPDRIKVLADEGVDAFTIGSAVFDGSFSPGGAGSPDEFGDQLRDILAACG